VDIGAYELMAVTGDAGDNTFVVSLLPSHAVQVQMNGTMVAVFPLPAAQPLTIHGYGGNDTLVYEASLSDDTFTVEEGTGTVSLTNAALGGLSSPVVVAQTGIENLVLGGLDGDDVFNVAGGHPFDGGVEIQGGNPGSGSDTLNFLGGGDDITVDLDSHTIQENAFGAVSFIGVEDVSIDGAGAALTVLGTPVDDQITYRPEGPMAGSFVSEGDNTAFDFEEVVGDFTINALGASADHVTVEGTNNRDLIIVDSPNRTATVQDVAGVDLKPVVLANDVEILTAQGKLGSDTSVVIPAPAVGSGLLVNIDGDWPGANDRLVVLDEGPGNLVRHHQGADGRSGSVIVGSLVPVAYYAVERVDILPLDPVTGGTGDDGDGRIVVFHADRLEQNDSRLDPTELPDLAESIVKANIDPGGETDPFGTGLDLPGDEDWYRYIAPQIGTFRFELRHEPVGVLSNGQPGLPGDGELMIHIYEADGTPIDKLPVDGPASHTIGVEQGESYLLRARGVTPEAINIYDIAVVPVDTRSPQVTDVYLTNDPSYDLFDPKPSTDGPTPLAPSLTVRIQDLPERFPGFLYGALDVSIAAQPGHYRLVGDHNGVIPIANVIVINDPVVVQQVATASIILEFEEPLADDRFTLAISDSLTDPPGQNLDGESNTVEPHEAPLFPSGDGEPGGDFVARFTVDSRPELGDYAGTTVTVDTNGNFRWDPENPDATNRDLTFEFGSTSDQRLTGKFNIGGNNPGPRMFDVLASYGQHDGQFLLRIDDDLNGAFDVGETEVELGIDGLTVAGNFDVADADDEIAVFDGINWHLDTDGDFLPDTVVPSGIFGYPIAGDFDGDSLDDLGTYQNDTFFFDLAIDGFGDQDAIITTLFAIGVSERPVAADMDQDGIDDIGLWIPVTTTQGDTAEWRFLLSDFQANPAGTVDALDHAFSPVPLGSDLAAYFGDPIAMPVVGNLDPPVATPAIALPDTLGMYDSERFYLDTNGNGAWDKVSGGDTFRDFGINPLRATATPVKGDWDGNGVDDLGLYQNGAFYLDANGNGVWDKVSGGDTFRDFGINPIRATATPVIGDWDGDGDDDLGLYNNESFFLDTNGNGVWDKVSGGDTFRDFGINPIRTTATPVIGDWDGDGTDDLGIHNGGFFYLDTNGNGVWDKVSGGDTYHDFGINPIRSTGLPLAGRWAAPSPLLAAGGPVAPDATVIDLTDEQLTPIVDQAVAVWAGSGLGEGGIQKLESVEVRIADLPGARLGEALGTSITVDVNAAGYGWYVSPRLGELSQEPADSDAAYDPRLRMDLLTVVLHELGHVLGHGDLDDILTDDVMNGWLPAGVRRL